MEASAETKKPRKFSRKQLRATQGLLTMQARTNIYASQRGMTGFGAVRHVSDIRVDNACPEGQGELTQIAKTHVFASQKGMTGFGAVRHGPDIRADGATLEGLSTLSLQTGTNLFASQKGMTSFGAVRHVSDIRVVELYEEGNEEEYPTDEDEPVLSKPAWKVPLPVPYTEIKHETRTEVHEPKPEQKLDVDKYAEPEIEIAEEPKEDSFTEQDEVEEEETEVTKEAIPEPEAQIYNEEE
ncbi:hypothetical protein DPMN_074715 [Dreissena polymorpha]|uniref:Uncharacterized protein n=1 Tax=Dreissena polymorpha TaxID=45954 RepID=A0A9D4BLU0_DREPO|nr:hypothetical protein DPMN_074715 [Dreissena polymorpha]